MRIAGNHEKKLTPVPMALFMEIQNQMDR